MEESILKDFKVIESDTTSGYTRYRGTSFSFGVYGSPFYNCQNFTIAGFNSVLTNLKNKDILQLCLELSRQSYRKLLLIDVHTSYSTQIHEIFEGFSFIIDQQYVSTNDSGMHLFYINLTQH